jgi:outer membrane biosynthesis protein TonB
MSIEKEKKPRKAPAKKPAVAAGAEKKTKAAAKPTVAPAAAKTAAPKAKAAAKSAEAAGVPEAAVAMTKTAARPTHQQIAERAYSFFIERGWRHGHHEQDWFRAEQELLTRR